MIEGMRGGCYCNLSPARMRCGAASSLDEGGEMTTTVKTLSQAWKCSRQYPSGLAVAEAKRK